MQRLNAEELEKMHRAAEAIENLDRAPSIAAAIALVGYDRAMAMVLMHWRGLFPNATARQRVNNILGTIDLLPEVVSARS